MTSAEEMLAEARGRLDRLGPQEAQVAVAEGALLVDIRADSQRAEDGVVPGAVHVPRNVAEWRFDPASPHNDPELAKPEARVVIMCQQGYQSSLVAATLQELGIAKATDLDGGFEAWRAAGLPVERP